MCLLLFCFSFQHQVAYLALYDDNTLVCLKMHINFYVCAKNNLPLQDVHAYICICGAP